MNGQPAGRPSVTTPRWQAAMAALSLVLLTAVVLLPMALLALGVWGLVLGVASAWSLDVVGVKSSSAMKEAVGIAGALFGLAAVITMVEAMLSGIMKLDAWRKSRMPGHAQPRVVIPPTNGAASWRSFLYEHPWFSLAGVALLVDGCVAPFHASKAIHLPPELLGGFILTGATLLFLFVVGYGLRGSFYWMRSLWSGVRQSPFFAGLMTAGCLLASATVLLIGHAFGQVASALNVPETTRALEACSGSADCSRRVLQSALDGQPRSPASLPSGTYTPERQASFDACVEEIYRQDNTGNSLRLWGIREAYRLTLNNDEAEDLVHGVIISVCLISDRVTEIRPYFVRSVQNAAKKEWRRSRRYCPITIDDPPTLPEACLLPTVEQSYIRAELAKAANDALCSLSGDERIVIELYVWEGLSHRQIADRLGISEEATRQRYRRARQNFETEFGKRCR